MVRTKIIKRYFHSSLLYDTLSIVPLIANMYSGYTST